MTRKIKAIIFDLGNVIIPLNIKQMSSHFSRLGATNAEEKFEQAAVKDLWKRFDAGLDAPTFRIEMKAHLGLPPSTRDQDFDAAWNALFAPIPADRIPMLKHLKSLGIRNLLNSNSNHIHVPFVRSVYGKDFEACFDKQYYSNETNVTKPAPQSYQQVLDEFKLSADEVLFFDDKMENIRGAQELGIHGKQFTIENPMSDVLNEMNRLNQSAGYKEKSTFNWGFFAAAAGLATAAVGLLWWKNASGNSAAPTQTKIK